MKQWQLQQAKARLSELVKLAANQGPQEITVRGKSEVVVLSKSDFERLKGAKQRFTSFIANSPLKDSDIEIDFVHMARNKLETIYFQELHQLDELHANFNLKLLLKDNEGTTAPQGRLDKNWLVKLSPDILERTVYLCGPVGFMQDIESYLKELEFNMDNFYQESFTPATQNAQSEASKAEVADDTNSAVKVFVPAFGAEVEAETGTPLADSLEKAGVPILIACRSGICGSCKCKVTKGSVESSSQETLTPEQIEQGYVLACSSSIQSDVEVEL